MKTINTWYDGFKPSEKHQNMDFLLLANHPFLDFVNTLPVIGGEAIELIPDGGSFLNMLGRLDMENRPAVRRLTDRDAVQISGMAREMREDFRRFLIANNEGTLESTNLEAVNSWFAKLGSPTIAQVTDKFVLDYQSSLSETVPPELSIILRSGLELITSPAFSKVRKCANPQCVLWYLDTTKSRTRRWCSMTMCGNVEKARSFRERHQPQRNS
ncbi:MAG: CGNR zinc finger domain-containing protein [Armatimonadota bacterium]